MDTLKAAQLTAFDMLVSYRQPHQQHQLHAQDGSMAFVQDHNDDGGAESHSARQDGFVQHNPDEGVGMVTDEPVDKVGAVAKA